MSTVKENLTTGRSSSVSNDSVTESEAIKIYRQDDSVDFFIVTRFPEENYRFKWLLNQFSKLPIKNELYSSVVHSLPSLMCRLKLVKTETEFILFHVTIRESEISNVNNSFSFGSAHVPTVHFGFTPLNTAVFIPEKTVTDEGISTPKLQYEVSAEDSHGKQLIKWSVIFPITDQPGCQVTGKYSSAPLTNLPNDMLILDCHLKVILEPTSEKKLCRVKPKLGNNSWKKLSMDLKALCLNPVDADVTLNVGADKVRAHKSVLAARSTVFKKIFHHDMKENERNSVVINDVPFSALQKLIEFLYTGVIQGFDNNITLQELYYLYYAADKYEVMDLRGMCGSTMLSRATVNDASQILMWADRHNDEGLKPEIMNFIRINFEAVTGTEAWEACLVNETRLAAEVVRMSAKKL